MTQPSVVGLQFGQFERDTLPERIAARLVSLIAERQLKPGDRLPPERELAALMQVSRASLREALAGLAMVNIVEIRQGSGAYVTSLKPELLVERVNFVFALDDSTFEEWLDARQIIEPGLASAAAVQASQAELEEFAGWLERSAEAVEDPAEFLQVDLELHEMIARAAGNQIIIRFMASLTRLGMASRERTGALMSTRLQSLNEHRAIVEALLCRDPQGAAEAMREHLVNVRKSLRESSHAIPVQEPNTPTGGKHVADHDLG
jgi:GntR family transcriptional repressor for pyruvate dehydrogenase complex